MNTRFRPDTMTVSDTVGEDRQPQRLGRVSPELLQRPDILLLPARNFFGVVPADVRDGGVGVGADVQSWECVRERPGDGFRFQLWRE